MYGRVDPTDDREPTTGPVTTGTVSAGRHRGRRSMPAPLALALTVTALLTVFGAATALLPGSFTGTGAAAQTPAGVIADLAPEAGAVAPTPGRPRPVIPPAHPRPPRRR